MTPEPVGSDGKPLGHQDPIEFTMVFGSTLVRLAALLQMRFVPGHRGSASFIASEIAMVMEYFNRGQLANRDLQLIKLALFTDHLQQLKDFDPEVLAHFRRKFHKRLPRDQFIGLRFEVAVAARLLRRGTPFEPGDRPDFTFRWNGVPLAIECTTATLERPRESNPWHKIAQVLGNKHRKPYAVPTTAVFVDITDVVQRASLSGVPVEEDSVSAALQRGMEGSRIGAAVGLYYQAVFRADVRSSGLGVQPVLALSPGCHPDLADFLPTLFTRAGPVDTSILAHAYPRSG